MHRRTYRRLKSQGMMLEAGLSKRMRKRFPDYASLAAYLTKRNSIVTYKRYQLISTSEDP
jgi:hypothetical protein